MTSHTRMRRKPDGDARCSFCGRSRDEVHVLVSGLRARICDACAISNERTLAQSGHSVRPSWRRHSPAAIKAALDERVVGQGHAKRVLAVALYNHYKRLAHRGHPGPELVKSNVLLIGPSGTGKTLLARTLADIAEVPFAIVDAASLTAAGYAGADVESILLRLLQAAEYDIQQAEGGILYIDGIDNIGRREWAAAGGRDIAGEGVQQALLRILEGAVVAVPPEGDRRYGRSVLVEIDTTNILFICGGRFEGLEEIVLAREQQASAGYGALLCERAVRLDALKCATAEDLVCFGLLPELVGRLPVLAPLDDLDEADLLAVLLRPRGSLVEQYKLLFRLSGVELVFERAALTAIARKAMERGTGARGLRAILEQVLLGPMFALPDCPVLRRLTIDREHVERVGAGALLGADALRRTGEVPPAV